MINKKTSSRKFDAKECLTRSRVRGVTGRSLDQLLDESHCELGAGNYIVIPELGHGAPMSPRRNPSAFTRPAFLECLHDMRCGLNELDFAEIFFAENK